MTMIDQRPAAAGDRVEVGHWEGDLIMGPVNGSAIGALVERATRTVMLVHLPHGRTAAACRDALVDVFSDLPAGLRCSPTWDQGKELSAHAELAHTVGMPVFSCQPHSPWQRGSNEKMNGLLRDYFPQGTDLAVHTAEQLAAVATELNNRPRKTLNWATPAALIAPHLTGDGAGRPRTVAPARAAALGRQPAVRCRRPARGSRRRSRTCQHPRHLGDVPAPHDADR